jgi:glycosyltransferase involved in cell wall biosynthesis
VDSKILNIAIFIGSYLESGGGYQYEYMFLDILKKYHKDKGIDFKFYGLKPEVINDYIDLDLNIKIVRENIFQKLHRICLSYFYLYNLFSKINMGFCSIERQLSTDDIRLVYFLSPSSIAQGLSNIPYIFTLWDLAHLDILEFPEVSHDRQFEARELIYTKSLKKAYRVIVDSNYGKHNAVKKYNLDIKRVEILKFLPNIKKMNGKYINIKDKYNIKNDYIFYPAQFWAHKNHIYILKAIEKLRSESSIDIDVIFSGSNKGNLEYILNKAKEFEISDLIHYIGFAPNEEMSCLYKQSLSLVMPTYLGPTNIPPLEAFSHATPVCYSDTPSFREQVEGAVFFLDLTDPCSLVAAILTIINDKSTVKEKKAKGFEILNDWNKHDFYNELLRIFTEYKYIRELWK